MDRERAKIELMQIYGSLSSEKQMAIDTLLEESNKSEIPTSCDTISREAVKQEIKCWIGSGEYRYAMSERFLFDRINNLTPVQPSRKGHWKWNDEIDRYVCDKCGKSSGLRKEMVESGEYQLSNFCPNCGADMRGVE